MQILSELLTHYESLAIYYKRDTNILSNNLAQEKMIDKCVTNDRQKEAIYYVEKLNMNLDNLVSGSTCILIETTMKYAKNQSNSQHYHLFTIPID